MSATDTLNLDLILSVRLLTTLLRDFNEWLSRIRRTISRVPIVTVQNLCVLNLARHRLPELPGDLLDIVDLDQVALRQVVESGHPNAALEARLNLSHVILEALQ